MLQQIISGQKFEIAFMRYGHSWASHLREIGIICCIRIKISTFNSFIQLVDVRKKNKTRLPLYKNDVPLINRKTSFAELNYYGSLR